MRLARWIRAKLFGDDGFDSQIERNESGVLTGRTLAIVLTADDDTPSQPFWRARELLVADGEAEVGQIGDVGNGRAGFLAPAGIMGR